MKKFLSRFEAPDVQAVYAFLTAVLGMFLAFGRITEEQFKAGGVLAMALLVLFRAKKPAKPTE